MLLRRVKRGFGRTVSLIKRAVCYLTGGSWKRALFGVAVIGCVFAIGGFLYAWLGLMPVAASKGHWTATQWFLAFTMRNSVELRSWKTKVPPLDDPALILKAAGHYVIGCAPCHGAPGETRSPIVEQMTPIPPLLPPKLPGWEPEQLFWIIKHGIKYTAMPGWVALEREDEIWAMVAFVRRLPELTPEQYKELAFGPHVRDGGDVMPYLLRPLAGPLELILANCARCHGFDGAGRGLGAFPKLAGQSEEYLLASLLAYAEGERLSGIMQPLAAGLNEETLRRLARYYAGLAPSALIEDTNSSGAAVERGRIVAEQGVPEQGVPSCIDCHGPLPSLRNSVYPKLAGQYADYLALQLQLFKAGKRGGTNYAHIMNNVASRLTQAQIRDLAAYYASLD